MKKEEEKEIDAGRISEGGRIMVEKDGVSEIYKIPNDPKKYRDLIFKFLTT